MTNYLFEKMARHRRKSQSIIRVIEHRGNTRRGIRPLQCQCGFRCMTRYDMNWHMFTQCRLFKEYLL